MRVEKVMPLSYWLLSGNYLRNDCDIKAASDRRVNAGRMIIAYFVVAKIISPLKCAIAPGSRGADALIVFTREIRA